MALPNSGNTALLNIAPGDDLSAVAWAHSTPSRLLEPVEAKGCHHFTELARRAMDAMGLDYQIVFPTPMLLLGMHPEDYIEVALSKAYNRWATECILPDDARLKGLVYSPFNTPEACVEEVERYADDPESSASR